MASAAAASGWSAPWTLSACVACSAAGVTEVWAGGDAGGFGSPSGSVLGLSLACGSSVLWLFGSWLFGGRRFRLHFGLILRLSRCGLRLDTLRFGLRLAALTRRRRLGRRLWFIRTLSLWTLDWPSRFLRRVGHRLSAGDHQVREQLSRSQLRLISFFGAEHRGQFLGHRPPILREQQVHAGVLILHRARTRAGQEVHAFQQILPRDAFAHKRRQCSPAAEDGKNHRLPGVLVVRQVILHRQQRIDQPLLGGIGPRDLGESERQAGIGIFFAAFGHFGHARRQIQLDLAGSHVGDQLLGHLLRRVVGGRIAAGKLDQNPGGAVSQLFGDLGPRGTGQHRFQDRFVQRTLI